MKSIDYSELQKKNISIDIAFLTAVNVERDAILNVMQSLESEKSILKVLYKESVYFIGKCGLYNVVLLMCEKGSTGRDGSILASTHLLDRWQPRALIMPGIAFGKNLDKIDQKLGDILISTQICPYESERIGKNQKVKRAPNPEVGLTLLNRAKSLDFSWHPPNQIKLRKPQFGPLLSGEKLVDNLAFKEQLFKEYPDAIGGEMEGVGVYAASSRSRVEWIVIKSICDWADGNKHKRAQLLAANNAAEFIKMMLSEPGLDQLPRADSENKNSNSLIKALDQATLLSQNFVLEALRNNIRDANRLRHQTGEVLREFIGLYLDENGNLKIPISKKDYVDTLDKSHKDAIEHWLNTYNDGCAKYLSGSINQYEFETLFREEIVELFEVDGPHRDRLNPQNASSYKALWKVYEKFKDQ